MARGVVTTDSIGRGYSYDEYYKEQPDKDSNGEPINKFYYTLYSIFPKNMKEYSNETSKLDGLPISKQYPAFYSNDNIIKPTVCNIECDMLYSELDREENDVTLQNETPFGYLRMLLKVNPLTYLSSR